MKARTNTLAILNLAIIIVVVVVSGKKEDDNNVKNNKAKNQVSSAEPPAPSPLPSSSTSPSSWPPTSSHAPASARPLFSPNQLLDGNNCDDPAVITKEACFASFDCEWIESAITGEHYCENKKPLAVAVEGSSTLIFGTSSSSSSSSSVVDDENNALASDVAVTVVESENCFLLSINQTKCTSASNCEWMLDANGNTYCKEKKPIIIVIADDDCDSFSDDEAQCAAATNCEYAMDNIRGNATMTCQPIISSSTARPTSSNRPSSTPSGRIDRCTNPNLSKQDCKDSLDCAWNKNECLQITPSPTQSPISLTQNPTAFPVTSEPTSVPTASGAPTEEGYVDCADDEDNGIGNSEEECNDALNCEWARDEESGEEGCVFGTRPPTSGPSEGPTEGPTNDPTPSPVTDPPTTNEPSTGAPSLRPTTNQPVTPTESPTVKPIFDPESYDNPNGTGEEGFLNDTAAVTAQEATDCLDPNIIKAVCQSAETCRWDENSGICEAITASPTTDRPTDGPSNSPAISSKPTTHAPTLSPSVHPSTRPSNSPSASPTVSIEPTSLPSNVPTTTTLPTISSIPTGTPTISHYPTMADYEYDRPKRNDLRFVPWTMLERRHQVIAKEHLRYTKESWDVLGSNAIEQLRWDDLGEAQKDAAVELGFDDEVSWNCWQNHWESFSWKQLYTLKLTPYLELLGWEMNTWNRQYTDQPMKRKGTWDELNSDQRWNAAHQLCHYKTSYDRLDIAEYGLGHPMAKPSKRFVPWEDVEDTLRAQLEQNMEYTELTWNVLRLAEVEQKGWFEFMYFEKDTATELGFDDASWNCWVNHYDSYGWNDLVKKGHDAHYSGLGWSEMSWDGTIDPPVSEQKSWQELSEEEQLHATELCFDEANWDRIDMTRNTGPFPFPKPEMRYTVWKNLSEEDRRIASSVLLYEERTWNEVGRADIEKRAWDDLTEYQKPYAIQLGLYHHTWDCFQNHYRATKWNKLCEDVRDAATTLGWDEDSWNKFLGEPDSYGKKWVQLREDEILAAYTMCHFNVTWPGDIFLVNLQNQYDGNDLIISGTSQVVVSMLPAVLTAVMSKILLL